MEEQAVYAYEFEGTRYDAGTTMGWLKASVELALQRPELAAEFQEYLVNLAFRPPSAGSTSCHRGTRGGRQAVGYDARRTRPGRANHV